jgi:hypothetical protein
MSIPAGTVWEVRTAGSDSNGGLYYAAQAGAGTDYSQQNSPQLSLTDVVTNGTTTVTSATGGFTAAMVANGINIAGVCYMIATRSDTNTITIDRTVSSASGQTGKVGGALASPGFASGQATTSNQVWIKAGTYTLTSTSANVAGGKVSSPAGGADFPFRWEGYQTTRGDKGTRPVIDGGATTGISLFGTGGVLAIFDNLEFTIPDSTSTGLAIINTQCRAIRCKASGVGTGISVSSAGSDFSLVFCEGANTTSTPFSLAARGLAFGCVAHGSAVAGFTGSNTVNYVNCLSFGNTGAGFSAGNQTIASFCNCTSYGNTGDGFVLTTASTAQMNLVYNCLAVSNGGYGFTAPSTSGKVALINCAGYNNTSGNKNALLTNVEGFVTLSADPFVSASTNFGLNSTSGGGAACRAAGLPGAFPGLASTTGYLDIGAVQHQDSGGGGGTGGGGRLTLSL